jgi:nucleoside-diphosphate-sugar epimerase
VRTLVTGAAGLIGRHLVARLLATGEEVRAMARPGAAIDPLLEGAEIVRGELTSAGDVRRCVEGCGRIFHLAANVTRASDRAAVWGPNVEGTAHLAEAAARAGVERLVFTSSTSVYGRAVSRRMLTEASEPRPDSVYGASKLAAEAALLAAHRRDGLPVVVVRTSNVLGPGAVAWLDLARRLAEGRFRMAGRGEGLHTLTDVEDFVDGLMLCAQAPGIAGEVFLLAAAQPLTLRAGMEAMCEAAGAPPPARGWPEGLVRAYGAGDRLSLALTGRRLPRADRLDLFLGDRSFDISKARRRLGFAPRIDGPETARRLVRWYRRVGLLP